VGYGEVLSPLYGTSYAEIQIQTDEQTGLFSIDYMLYSTTVFDGYTPRGLRTVVQVDSVMLTWTAPAKTEGLVGYNVYRDGLLLNPNPIVDTTYIDENLAAGVFYYSTSSLYENGSEHLTPYEMKGLVFSGGTGEPNEPFRIAMAEQLASIAEFPDLLDKHLVLANDINLDPNLFGGRVFDKAVIPAFSGTFDGNDHTLSHLTIKGKGAWFGLFGELESGAEVKDLAIVDVNITGSGNFIGGLVGRNKGHLTSCYITGTVSGDRYVGGLVGHNHSGSITNCYSTGAISGIHRVGGLVGSNCSSGSVTTSYSSGTVSGDYTIGGLVGDNGGGITNCYSTGTVNGGSIGGLVGGIGNSLVCMGYGGASITNCYSTGTVNGGTIIGGLAGWNYGGDITLSFWDVETSGLLNMCGRQGRYTRTCDDSFGKTTTEMQTASTFLEAGWDFVGEIENGIDNIWYMKEGQDYPRLWWEWWEEPTTPYGGGSGEPNDPYMIGTAEELISLGRCRRDYGKHFILTADIDLNPNLPGREFLVEVVIAPQRSSFTGIFDGNGHTISNLPVALFGSLGSGAEVRDLGLVDVNISSGISIGALSKDNGGIITNCYSTGIISGDELVGGLVSDNHGIITNSYSTSTVSGNQNVGGLVAFNSGGNVINSYSAGSVESDDINDFKVQHLYVLTRSGILEVSLVGGQRIIVNGHYDSYALKIMDDILYVTEKTRGGNIVAYDLEGHYRRTIPTPPQANSYLTFVVLPDDKFALLDNSNDKVFFIDYEGNLIATTSIQPVKDSHLQNLDGIVVDNRLILSEDGDGRVLEIDLASYEMSIFKDFSYLPHWLSDIAYANGTYYICSPKIVYAFTDSGSAVPVAEIQDYTITGIVVIEDCAYVSVSANFAGKVYKIDLISGATSVLVSDLDYPREIVVSSAERHIGGLIGHYRYGDVINCFWDTETSGQTTSDGGASKTTAETQTASTFLEAGWDFMDEVENGTDDIWWILEGQDYPRLWWELIPEN
jgi:hypothetical protein